MILVNACLICLNGAETMDSIFVSSRGAHALWISSLGWFDYNWVLMNSVRAIPSLEDGSGIGEGQSSVKSFLPTDYMGDLGREE